jgi:hypothetical protein
MAIGLLLLIAVLLPAGAVAAPRANLGSFGTPNGESGGQLVFARGIAVNQSGIGAPSGSVYVAEANANHRISQFTEEGAFVRAWGYDVVRSGQHNSGASEQQKLTLKAPSGGKFRLEFNGVGTGAAGTGFWSAGATAITVDVVSKGSFAVGQIINSVTAGIQEGTEITGCVPSCAAPSSITISKATTAASGGALKRQIRGYDIPYNETASGLEGILNGFSTIGGVGGSVSVARNEVSPTEFEYTITFGGTLGGNDVPALTEFTAQGLIGAGKAAALTTPVPGGGFEVCQAASSPSDVCKASVGGGSAGQLSNPHGIAVDQSTGYLYVTSVNNRRVDVFTGEGAFVGAFGWDVADTGDPGDTSPVNQLEICTAVCKSAAAAGSDAGRFSNLEPSVPAIDPNVPGRVYVPDLGNLRVNQFTVTTAANKLTSVGFDKAFGWDVVPTNATTTLESCTVVTTCQAGTSGSGPGQFASGSPTAVAVDSGGAIYVTSGPLSGTCSEATPCRVQKFAPDASSATDFGPTEGEGQLTFTSGPASAVAGINLAVDPSNDHVFVLRKETGTTYRIYEYDSAGTYLERHPSAEALNTSNSATATTNSGLAVGNDECLYVNYGSAGSGEVFVLCPVPAPVPSALEVSNIGTTEATFSGVVDIPAPGAPTFTTKFHFEYWNGVDWTRVPDVDQDVGDGSTGSHSVAATGTGLEPNTKYLLRLAASTGNDDVFTETIAFTTAAAPPSIERSYVEDVTQTSAELGAHIDPQGQKTNYHFEWTSQQEWEETGEFAHRVPAVDRHLGAGSTYVIARDGIDGLQRGTRYRFRAVATNATKERTIGPDQQFETLNECGLTAGRCYELVSRSDKGPVASAGDISVAGEALQFQAAADRPAIAYNVAFGYPDASTGGEVLYEADRDPSGWDSFQLTPPSLAVPGMAPPTNSASYTSFALGMSANLACGVFISNQILSDDAPIELREQGNGVLYSRTAGGFRALTTTPPTNQPVNEFNREYQLIGMDESGDGCHRVVFRTEFHYPGIPGVGTWRLYEWVDGSLRNLGVVPGAGGNLEVAEAVPGAPRTFGDPPGSASNQLQDNYRNVVSPGGSRVFFTAVSREGDDLGMNAVYVRERQATAMGSIQEGSSVLRNIAGLDGAFEVGQEIHGSGIPQSTTVAGVDLGAGELTLSAAVGISANEVEVEAFDVTDVSQSQNPSMPNTGNTRYEIASGDGRFVFFTARRGLDPERESGGPNSCSLGSASNGGGCSLYRYDVATAELRDLSVPEDETDNTGGPGVAGVIDVSHDGSHAYFAARGQLVPSEGKRESQNLADDTFSIYLWSNDILKYVGSVGRFEADHHLLAAASMPKVDGLWTTRITPDGRHILYLSADDPADFTGEGERQAYLYSVESGETICISCRRDGEPSVAPAIDPLVGNGEVKSRDRPPTTLVEGSSGSITVFFRSQNRLATGATSGRPNIYQWKDGQVTFLASSAPSAGKELRFAGASRDGADVYFTTIDQLTWEDTDGKLDVYDARVGGGFLEPPSPPQPCDPLLEASCQSTESPAAPAPVAPGSTQAQAGGNVHAEKPRKKTKSKKKKKASNKKKRGNAKGKGKSGRAPTNRRTGR